jgi:BolA family transcriptional regulator, general stress-responsive regulator
VDYGIAGVKNKTMKFLTLPRETRTLPRMRVADAIHQKLTAAFAPVTLEVGDESARHAGHAGAAREDGGVGETHFHVRLVTASFEGVPRVERQRRVHAALAEELRGPVHALSLKLQTPGEAARS